MVGNHIDSRELYNDIAQLKKFFIDLDEPEFTMESHVAIFHEVPHYVKKHLGVICDQIEYGKYLVHENPIRDEILGNKKEKQSVLFDPKELLTSTG